MGITANIVSYNTDHRAAESPIQVSYTDFAQNVPSIIYAVSPDGLIKFLSPTFEEVTGYPSSEWLGKPFTKLIHPDDERQATCAFGRLLRQESIPGLELRIASRQGQYLIGELKGSAQVENGRVTQIIGYFRDRTVRRRALEALRRAFEWQEAIFEGSRDAIFISNSDSQFILVNEQAVSLTGYSKQELLSMRIPDLHDKAGLKAYLEYHESILTGSEMISEAPILRKDGSKIDVEFNNRRIIVSGTVFIHTVARDVTERKKSQLALLDSEERYRSLFQRNLSGIYRSSLDGRILDCNEAFALMLGYDSREEVIAAGARNLYFKPSDREAHLERLAEEGTLNNVELYLKRKDGSPFCVLQNVSLISEDSDEPMILEGIMMDITERKQAEENLRHSREQLRALSSHLQSVREEERARIAREIHDELGQALTGLKMDLFWLGDSLGEDPKRLATKIKAMSALVDATIQSIRRIATEMRPRILDDLGLTAAIEWQLQEFQNRTRIKCKFNSKVENRLATQPRSVTIFRIVQEALTNIARHANASQVRVALKEQRDRLILTVEDNGRGITKSEINSSKSLGLLGMRERAQAWGGDVEITGSPGKGATLTVRIPIRRKQNQVAPQVADRHIARAVKLP